LHRQHETRLPGAAFVASRQFWGQEENLRITMYDLRVEGNGRIGRGFGALGWLGNPLRLMI
jgi:hypothetical protein